jgi:hypothetical protein
VFVSFLVRAVLAFAFVGRSSNSMVSFHGRVALGARRSIAGGMHHVNEIPPDPRTLLRPDQLEEKAQMVS